MSVARVTDVIDLQVLCEVPDLPVLMPLGGFGGRGRASSPDGDNNIEVGKWVGDTAEPPSSILNFCMFLGGEAKFVGVTVVSEGSGSMRQVHTPGCCHQWAQSSPWFE